MRIILCLLALVVTPASAGWVRLGATDYAIHYYDPVTIRKTGNYRSVQELQDLKKRDEQGVMSRRSVFEYDCKKERSRLLSFTSHSGIGAMGKVLSSDDKPEKWSHSERGTVTEAILKVVCAN